MSQLAPIGAIRATEPLSGLEVTAHLLPDSAPANVDWLVAALATPLAVPSIHAMWTGPEISAPLPPDSLDSALAARALPLENATIMPQPGEFVLTWLAPRIWGGGASPVFDLGLYYGPGARCLFPIGWQAGSVVARVDPAGIAAFAAACGRIRRAGACIITFSLVP